MTTTANANSGNALDAARAHFEAKRPHDAIALLSEVLEGDPDNADALYLSGVIASSHRLVEQAIDLLQQTLEVRPDFADAHLMLGNVLTSAGRNDEALHHWRRALVLKPGNAAAHCNIARVLGERGEHADAIESARRAINLDPTLARAQFVLGRAHAVLGQVAAAEAPLRLAVQLEPDELEFVNTLALLLSDTKRIDEGIALARTVIVRDPANVTARRTIAHALLSSGAYDDAAREMAKATAELPNWAGGWQLLASALGVLGELDEAAAALERAVTLDPNNTAAQRALAQTRRRSAEPAETERLQRLADDQRLTSRARSDAGFALGTLFDDARRYDEAFAAFAAANKLVHEANATADDRFNVASLRRGLDGLIGAFSPETTAAFGDSGDASELPVFIVGMPRSGTSLVEQICASHRRVFGAGELMDIPGITLTLHQIGPAEVPRAVTEPGLRAARLVGRQHLEKLRRLGGEALRVTDKLPDNVFNLGTVAAIFPRARIIVCRRDPRDASLSCYFQKFAAHAVMFSYDLAECGHWANAVDEIAAHWRDVLPLRMLEVQYEELVSDLEGQSRRLIDFLGLEWEPRCLDFHRTARPVGTASAWQVRQPLYSSSVERWRHYERHLDPLLAVLRTPARA